MVPHPPRLGHARGADDNRRIDQLVQLARNYLQGAGAIPRSWNDLIAAGLLRDVPVDPTGVPYVLDGARARIMISPESTLNPLPVEPIALDRVPGVR